MNDILIIILLILLNGVFSMAEIALLSARKSRLTSDAKRGSKSAKMALRLAENSDNFLSTIQIGITLIGILTGLFSGAAVSDSLGEVIARWGLPPHTARIVAQVSVVVIVTYLSIVVGELVPKRIGLTAATSVAKIIARPMYILSLVAMPAVWLLSKSTSLIIRLLGLHSNDNSVTEEEIKSLIQDGTDSGEILEIEQNIMERTLILGDLRVSAIMTPKPDIVAMDLSMTAPEVRTLLAENLHTNYPVYTDRSHDDLCGVVTLKHLVLSIGKEDFSLQSEMETPIYIPESMRVYDALELMKADAAHFAVICDEFGDITGVLTPGDILDGLVGVMPEQSSDTDILPTEDEKVWIVSGQTPIYDFINHFDLEEYYTPGTYSTVSGLILEELRHVPSCTERLEWHGLTLEITEMDGARIHSIRVHLPQAPHD